MANSLHLPRLHQAIVISSTSEPPALQTLPTPQATLGSAVVRILCANVLSYAREIYNGKRQYPFPTPLVAGNSAIGRIVTVGPDATLLKSGDLVLVDITIRSRDDPTAVILSGIIEGFSEGSQKLMRGEWRDSTYAEYAKVPLETCTVLDEKRLCGSHTNGGLGYKLEELAHATGLLVPYGGMRDIALQAGETVIVAPATSFFGQAAVHVALAMGAKVIAMGRNQAALEAIARQNPERITAVPITGDMQADTAALKSNGPIDVYFDISPPFAAQSTHLKSCILTLRHGGRVSLMGGIKEDVPFPYHIVMHGNMTLKGKWMYERSDVKALVKMVEMGVLKLGGEGKMVRTFGLGEWDAAFTAAEKAPVGEIVVFVP